LITDWDFKGISKAKITTSKPLNMGPIGPFDPPVGEDGKNGKGKKGTDDLIARLKKLAETISALQDLTRRPFGEDSFIQKEFGDISSADKIVSAFDKTKKAVVDFYDAAAAVASKAGKASLGKRKDSALRNLREQTQKLVDLANENKRLAQELNDWRRDEGARVQKDIDALKAQYEGYNDARGYAVKGLIEKAQDSLDAATQAYEDANSKLQDLISARDSFLASIRESARSFVNALAVSSEMVQKYTRLDDAGSFMIEEKQKSASLKEQMAARLETVKKFSENMKILLAQGLNGNLLQDLVAAGPEAAGEAMQELVNGGQSSIDEINKIQEELDSVIGGIQGSASAAWFDPAINAQQGVVNQLAAAKAAAEQALKDAQAAYNMRLAQLEEYQKAVEAGTDVHSLALTERMKANETAAQEIADGIQNKLGWLTDPKNKSNTDILGSAAIQGFINGMESKRDAALRKAQSIADAVARTIANAFEIKSPSRLMMRYGAYITEGLALGMESALPKVEAASLRVSNVALPSISGDGPGAPTVIVKIGERELTDIVNTQVISHDQRQVDFVLAGRR
jgi:phosphoribosylanthranilate isomerase